MTVRATVNIGNGSVGRQDLEQPVANDSGVRPAIRRRAQHLPNQRQNVWNGAVSIFVMFA